MTAFVFKVALPPMLFLAMTRAPDATAEGLDLLLGYAIATIGLYALVRLAGWALFRLRGGENALFGYISINGNVGFLGLPLISLTLGDEALLAAATVLAFDTIIMMTGTAMQLEAAKARGGSRGDTARALARAIFNPVPIAVFGGLSWGWAATNFDLALPGFVARMLELLASAAPPAALFATGAVLGRSVGDQRLGEVGLLMGAKLVIHPVLVALSLAYFAPDLPPLWAAAGVLAAACPASNNAVLLATNFGSYAARASAVALFSTALAILTYAAAAAWLQGGG